MLKRFKKIRLEDIEENELTLFQDIVELKFRIKTLSVLMGILILIIAITSYINIYLLNKMAGLIGNL